MNIQDALGRLLAGHDLEAPEMAAVMRDVMTGAWTPAQVAGFLVALRMKGESDAEIAAAAGVMRELMTPVTVPGREDLLTDIVGTGGDGLKTFNISTAASFVAAAAGVVVAKHGNRAVSSTSGAADVLEALGVRIDLTPEGIAECITNVGLGFMFAPSHHAAMRHAIEVRRDLRQRTVFNLLGPLTNPASARRQVVGVYDPDRVEPMARVLGRLGSTHALVVHADDGMDEFSIAAGADVAELRDGRVEMLRVEPRDFAFETAPIDALVVNSAAESAAMIRAVLSGDTGPGREIVALNAGAAIYVGGRAESFADGVATALAHLADGSALSKLDALAEFSNGLTGTAA